MVTKNGKESRMLRTARCELQWQREARGSERGGKGSPRAKPPKAEEHDAKAARGDRDGRRIGR